MNLGMPGIRVILLVALLIFGPTAAQEAKEEPKA